jgi:hypothetical protein
MFRRFALYRPRSGYVAGSPDASGAFARGTTRGEALRFHSADDAERFRLAHRDALGGGWRVERLPGVSDRIRGALARFLGRA